MPIPNDRPCAVSIGWELEATARPTRVPPGVVDARDGSVNGEGREYRIADNYVERHADSLQSLYALATDPRLAVDRSCGFHVHVGLPGQPMERKRQWALFFYELGRRVEESAFRAVDSSRANNRYCERLRPPTMAVGYWDRLSPPHRYQWVNISNLFIDGEIATVEIRLLGNTRSVGYLLGWLAACVAMGKAANRLLYDPTRLEIETLELRNQFDFIASHLGPNAIDGQGWADVVALLRYAGLPTPRRVIPERAPAQPAQVRRTRQVRAVVTPITVTEEIIRQAQAAFTIVPVAR